MMVIARMVGLEEVCLKVCCNSGKHRTDEPSGVGYFIEHEFWLKEMYASGSNANFRYLMQRREKSNCTWRKQESQGRSYV
jgi:hypothetical protein